MASNHSDRATVARFDESYQPAQLKSSQLEENDPAVEILDDLLIRKLKKDGEFYFNVFDFFQKMHRWMYNEGLFSIDD